MFLAMQAGAALEGALNLQGEVANLIHQHSQAAHILAVVFTLFTAVLILNFAAHRISGGSPTGLEIVDRLLSPAASVLFLRHRARSACARLRLHGLPGRRPRREGRLGRALAAGWGSRWIPGWPPARVLRLAALTPPIAHADVIVRESGSGVEPTAGPSDADVLQADRIA